MGGKTVGGRTSCGETMHPRISAGRSPLDSSSVSTSFYSRKERSPLNGDFDVEDMAHETPSLDPDRKNSFDIISLLENQDDSNVHSESEKMLSKRSENSSELPSFWHFVDQDPKSHDIFHHPMYQHHHHNHTRKTVGLSSLNHREDGGNGVARSTKKSADPKRVLKRRKVKKAQSAKISGLEALERSSARLKAKDQEWLRVLTPPGTGSSSLNSANNDSEEDELIRRYFSGLSSAGSSISWAEDAMESEFTNQLSKLWEDIENVCGGASRPEKMSNAVYEECMQWRKAFPNPNLHRFSSFGNDGELSSVASPVMEEEQGDLETVYSSLVHSSSPRSFSGGRKSYEESMNLLPANFRALNCSTPRPNIEKSTEYVSAWLSECQNSHVPDGNRPISSDGKKSTFLLPSMHTTKSYNQTPDPETETDNKGMHSLRLVSEVARSSYSHYSRSHAKFVNEPDPTNFFTSLAITKPMINESNGSFENKANTAFVGNSMSTMGTDMHNMPFGLPRFNGVNNSYHSRINESDEEDDDGSTTPTEIVSFRPNVRIQRPISSRIRDHAITPIATGSYVHSSFGGRQHAVNLNKQTTMPTLTNSYPSETYRGGRIRMFETLKSSAAPMSAKTDMGSDRIKSGFVRQGQSVSLASQLARSKQQPWSRHSGDDLTAEANYVASLYENYPGGE